jgi:hypothetical protein
MITVGPMALNQPQAADPMEPFFLGTQSGGGYWTDISRLSSHDHSGGLMGAAVAVNIPDGSITAADLDPSVLAPYALVDGSKPFTGQVTMQADAVVRDALYFGQQGTALAPDVTLSRTGAGALRVDTHLGVGVNPAAWAGTYRALQVGVGGSLYGTTNLDTVGLGANMYSDGTTNRAIATGAAATLGVGSAGGLEFYTAPSVAAGAALAFTRRAQIAPTGTLTLTPDAASGAIIANGLITTQGNSGVGAAGFQCVDRTGGVAATSLYNDGGVWYLHQSGVGTILGGNNVTLNATADNRAALGASAQRWTVVYAVAGAINTSSRDLKEGITPLSPERAMQAVRDTEAVTFDYVAPTRGPEWYDLPDDPEQAEQVLQQRLTAAPLEAAARHQHGFIAEAADELFLVGPGQTSPGSSIGVLLAALQQLDARVQTLEGAA